MPRRGGIQTGGKGILILTSLLQQDLLFTRLFPQHPDMRRAVQYAIPVRKRAGHSGTGRCSRLVADIKYLFHLVFLCQHFKRFRYSFSAALMR